jgi:hypothetical protein
MSTQKIKMHQGSINGGTKNRTILGIFFEIKKAMSGLLIYFYKLLTGGLN